MFCRLQRFWSGERRAQRQDNCIVYPLLFPFMSGRGKTMVDVTGCVHVCLCVCEISASCCWANINYEVMRPGVNEVEHCKTPTAHLPVTVGRISLTFQCCSAYTTVYRLRRLDHLHTSKVPWYQLFGYNTTFFENYHSITKALWIPCTMKILRAQKIQNGTNKSFWIYTMAIPCFYRFTMVLPQLSRYTLWKYQIQEIYGNTITAFCILWQYHVSEDLPQQYNGVSNKYYGNTMFYDIYYHATMFVLNKYNGNTLF